MHVSSVHVSADTYRGQKILIWNLIIELHIVVHCLMWVQGIKLRSS